MLLGIVIIGTYGAVPSSSRFNIYVQNELYGQHVCRTNEYILTQRASIPFHACLFIQTILAAVAYATEDVYRFPLFYGDLIANKSAAKTMLSYLSNQRCYDVWECDISLY